MSVVEEEQTSKICCLSLLQPELGASSDLRGGGWSILWREEDADRWAWFIRKISGCQSEKPTLGQRPIHVCFREKSGHRILSASRPFLTHIRHQASPCVVPVAY